MPFFFLLPLSKAGVDVEINNVTSLSSLGIINSTSASDTNNTIIVYDLSQNSPIPPGDDIQLVNLTFSTSSPLEPPYQISLEGVSFSKLDGSGKPTSASVEVSSHRSDSIQAGTIRVCVFTCSFIVIFRLQKETAKICLHHDVEHHKSLSALYISR